ncbi:hypothetical protein C8R46DRAFT_1060940 [Mycena filopes]|nr:hypothetical protein C8R46DRAFT_1060940 [Mycena filopes]
MKPYSTLPIRPPPSAGTVTSLRHATFGDQFSGPSSVSTPYRSTSVHPMSPALSMSPSTSPRPPTPLPADTGLSVPHDASLAATCRAPPETQTSYPGTREHSVGAHRSSNAALPRDIPSRSSTVERDGNVHPESPSADTIREELSVSNMMSPHSGTHSNVASPTRPFPPTEDEDVVPSSVTPSPMLGAQIPASSPPRLTLDIPVTVPAPSYPSAGDLFDPFMSPLSSTNPSAAPSPSPPPKDERMEERIPTTSSPPSGRPTVSGLRLRAPDLGEPAGNVPQKRKLESDSTKQPPMKRPRGRPSKQHAGPSVKQEKGKKRKKLNEPVWPEVIPEDASPAEFIGKFIGCDNCERWFHYTCMAIVRDDPRVDGTFHCPFCVAAHPPLEGADDPTAEQCKRPDCPTKGADYEVDGVFGRYTKLDSTRGRLVFWLMRWKGYPWSEATWQTFAPDEAIEEFYKRASAEGFDREDDSVSCIMLAEAQAGGAMDPSDP